MQAQEFEVSSEDELNNIEKNNTPAKYLNQNKLKEVDYYYRQYRDMLITEQNRLIMENSKLQSKLQMYYDLESELLNFVDKIGLDINSKQKNAVDTANFSIDFK